MSKARKGIQRGGCSPQPFVSFAIYRLQNVFKGQVIRVLRGPASKNAAGYTMWSSALVKGAIETRCAHIPVFLVPPKTSRTDIRLVPCVSPAIRKGNNSVTRLQPFIPPSFPSPKSICPSISANTLKNITHCKGVSRPLTHTLPRHQPNNQTQRRGPCTGDLARTCWIRPDWHCTLWCTGSRGPPTSVPCL